MQLFLEYVVCKLLCRLYLVLTTEETYNITLRRVRVTIVAMENQYVLHIMSVCFYSSILSGRIILLCTLFSHIIS
jgi:hypothetical protein